MGSYEKKIKEGTLEEGSYERKLAVKWVPEIQAKMSSFSYAIDHDWSAISGFYGALWRLVPFRCYAERKGEGTFAFSYNRYFSIISSKRMKKKIRVSEELSSASTSYFFIGEEARMRFKYHCLLQDYQELFKETREKGERLKMIMQKKLQLLAEVKFLRRKCHQFSAAQSVQFKLGKQSHRFPSASVCITEPKNPLFQTKLPSKSRNQEMKEVPHPTSTLLLDLNQVFLPTGEEMERFEVKEKLLNVERLKKLSSQGGDVLANDSVFSVLRDRRMGWAGKSRVSWQDQQTLRV